MTCHSIQVSFDGTVSEADAESAIDSVLTSYESVVPEQSSPSTTDNVTYRNSGGIDEDGEDYHYCLYRFDGSQTLSNIVADLETELGNVSASWYQIESHECYHDDPSGGACGDWQVQAESGTIPSGV